MARRKEPSDETVTPDAEAAAGAAEAGTTGGPCDPEPEAAATDSQEMTDASEPQPAEPEAEAVDAAPVAPREVVVERRGGFVPLVLGGLVAAGIGFGAAQYLPPGLWPGARPDAAADEAAALRADLEGRIAALDARLAALTERAAEVAPAPVPDAGAMQAAAEAALAGPLAAATGPIADRLDALEARLAALEARPAAGSAAAPQPGIPPEEVAALRALIERQEAAVAEARAAAEARLAETDQRLAAAEARATDLAAAAEAARADLALARLRTAVETGAPFDMALADLRATGREVPDALAAHAGAGVAPLADLRRAFPEAARAGLAAALQATAGDGLGARAVTFLRAQVGARSLDPRAGDDPDAVLSRAEAALDAGDLAAALAELQALPEAGRAAMAEWLARAEARQAAGEALDTLAATG